MTGARTFRAITFDCYGTLIDWDGGVAAALGPWAAGAGLGVPMADFLGAFADAQCRNEAMRPFRSYRNVLHDAFIEAADAHGVRPSAADARAFAASVGAWPAFPDTVAALARLKADHLLGVVSNVDDASFAETHGLLGGLIDEVVSADMVRSYKPGVAHFETMLRRLEARGIGRADILHIAQSRFHDIAPARRLGIACLLVDRRAGAPGRGINIPSDAESDYRVTGMAEAADLVQALREGLSDLDGSSRFDVSR